MRPSLTTAARWTIALLAMAGILRADDEDRDRAVMERFLSILEKAPRRGTALDRVYGYHVERGSLETLLKTYRQRNPDDGLAPMLVGLIESQRGKDPAAVAAFKVAEAKRPEDPLPSFYLGQSLVMVGEPSLAAEAFERALKREPSRSDLLDIFQALGRVHQRARKDELAMAAWSRLEARFPDDPKVKELIASSLAEESKDEPALGRYEDLARTARDPYRKVQFRLEAADLKVKLGRKGDALRDFEGLLGSLDPESWLGREVRRKIEGVFLRDDDQAGLAGYYEAWIKANPEDVDAMTRLGRTLASQGRSADARTWLDRALKLAPSRKALRLAMADQLAADRKFAEAAEQYEILSKAEPGNPDLIRDWGRMLLRDATRPEADRKKRASEVWNRLTESRPNDASAASQVAELYRQAGMADEAIALYRKAVDLAPGLPQYREYLGEYYHAQKRKPEALATWRGIADGPSRDSKNLRRLAEILDGFGYKPEAVAAIADACSVEPDSFDLRLKHADLLLATREFDQADAQLALAEKLADSEEAREHVMTRRIAGDEASGRLKERLEAVRKLANAPGADSAVWRRLARYAEAARQPAEAVVAAEKAVAIDPTSVAGLVTLARLRESTGRFLEAAEAFRKLASIDRRARSEHLNAVARLEAGLGRREEAMAAGRDLLAASPGNPETLKFFADLCFQLGERDEGLESLRKAARATSADIPALLNLAEALAREFRTEEAIEQLWRAFERSTDIEAKVNIVAKLADLHLQRNQVDRLVGRLDRLAREEGHQREGTLCLAQAYTSIGDLVTARQKLDGLLAASPRDVGLLQQLSRVAEQEGEMSLAVKYQKQLVDVAPGPEAANRLVELALKSGEFDVAEAIWSRAAEADGDLARVLGALDSLLVNGKPDAVLATTSRLLTKDPANWELLYREARALSLLDRRDEARARFRAILDLRLDDDDLSAITRSRRKALSNSSASSTASPAERIGPRYRMSTALTVRGVFALDPQISIRTNTYFPADFGQGRLSAIGGLVALARREKAEPAWLEAWRRDVEQAPGDVRRLRDDYYLGLVENDRAQTFERAKTLVMASGRDVMADYALLMALNARNLSPSLRTVADSDPTPELPAADLDLIRDAYLSIARSRPAWLTGPLDGVVQDELRKAGRLGEIDGVYTELIAGLIDPYAYAIGAGMAAARGDFPVLKRMAILFDRLPASVRNNVLASQPYYLSTSQGVLTVPGYFMAQGMRIKADAKAHGEILGLLDDQLARLGAPARIAERARAVRTPALTAARYAVFTAPTMTLTPIEYPVANTYLGHEAIQTLRTAFALFLRDGMIADLKDHLHKSVDAGPTDVQARLALAAVLWWSDSKDEATAELARAVAIVPGDVELKLGLAEVRAQRKEADEALAVLDSIEATDQEIVKRRETLALRLAVAMGRTDRASLAAERLFGLRLDNPSQLQLATQMRQLGMNELADAVLARARRRSGNDVDALVGLMALYRRQGDTETAAQIALQILRKTPTRLMAIGQTSPDLDDPNHAQAILVLAGSGKLKEQIDRVEAQLKLSPTSLPLRQTLVSYYKASNQPGKLKAEYEAILRLRPDDLRLRMQVAGQLVRLGPENQQVAIDEYKAVLRKDPTLYTFYATEISTTFLNAGQPGGLLELLDEIGLRSTGSFGPIANLTSTLLKNPLHVDKGLILLGRVWEAFPDEREFLLTPLLADETFWARPGAYRFAREAVIPSPETAQVLPWSGLDNLAITPVQAGRTLSVPARLLDLAARDGKLDELAGDLEAANKRWPRWQSGRTMLGLVRVRQGRVDEGKSILDAQLDSTGIRPSYTAIMLAGQELRDIPATQSVARRFYREAIKPDFPRSTFAWGEIQAPGFEGSAVNQVIHLEQKAGRSAEAAALLREAVSRNVEPVSSGRATGYSAELLANARVGNLVAIGETARLLGEPAIAFHAFQECLAATENQQLAMALAARPAQAAGPVPVNKYLALARDGIEATLKGLDHASAAAVLRALVPIDGKGVVDLALIAHPREVDRATITSLFASAIAAADPSGLATLKADLTGRTDDVRAATALALASREPADFAQAVARLEALLMARPLDPIPAGKRANSRQQAEALDRVGLWLVARECARQEATRPAGDRLSALAIEAARRQADPTMALAMLRESGQAALDRGESDLATARWSTMLDLILDAQQPSTPGRVPTLTLDRFRLAVGLARLAVDAGLTDLSLKSIRESLKGGPPVGPLVTTPIRATTVGPVVVSPSGTTTVREAPPDPTYREVDAALLALDIAWNLRKVPAASAYEVIREVVLPPGRPTDVFSYGPGANEILIRRAAQAGQLDDLRNRVAKRATQPASRLAARQLMTEIEAARKRSGQYR